jgi:ABC-2 type transport system permease protein
VSRAGWGRVGALVSKDLRAFSRDRFFVLVSLLGIAFYVLVLYLLPASVDETVGLGITGLDLPPGVIEAFGQAGAEEGLALARFDDRDALLAAIAGEGDEDGRALVAGIAFPEGFVGDVRAGEQVTVEVIIGAAVPVEVRGAVSGMVRELAYAVAGEQLPVALPSEDEIIVGIDRAGDQVSLREQMRPLFAFLVLLVETFALATLVAGEIQTRTLTALLVTPLRIPELLTAKTIVGTGLAFTEATLLLALTGSLQMAPGPLLLTLILGSLLVTGVGLVAGSLGRDFLGIIGWSMVFMVPLAIPAFSVLFPGSVATWVTWLPTHGFVAALVGLTAHDLPLADVSGELAGLAAWGLASLVIGTWTLRHRVARL